jgi:hypothetical protein
MFLIFSSVPSPARVFLLGMPRSQSHKCAHRESVPLSNEYGLDFNLHLFSQWFRVAHFAVMCSQDTVTVSATLRERRRLPTGTPRSCDPSALPLGGHRFGQLRHVTASAIKSPGLALKQGVSINSKPYLIKTSSGVSPIDSPESTAPSAF